jgi:hypothetical protein
VIAACGVVAAERSLRAHGHRPSVLDDEVLWAHHRGKVVGAGPRVAVLGSSRMQLGFDAAAFAEAAPGYHAVQLAIDGSSPLGTLRDLAADPSFRGTALVDLAEWELGPDATESQARYVARYHDLWHAPGLFANRLLAAHVQEHLAVLGVGGRQLLAAGLGARRWPEPSWVATAKDRTRRGDYSLASAAALAKRTAKNRERLPAQAPPAAAWLADAAALEPWVRAIAARGGAVVIVRMPTAGEHRARAAALFPRRQYWDVFAATTTATALHFEDLPGMASLELPDEIHLDQRAARTFTLALVAAARRRGALPPLR